MEQTDITSLIPIVITLVLSLATRNVVIGLFAGVLSGVAMLTGMFSELNPLDTFGTMVKSYLVPQLTDSYNAGVIILLVFIGVYWWFCCSDGEVRRWRCICKTCYSMGKQ